MTNLLHEYLVPYKHIPVGNVFYLAKHHGNTYRKIDERTAEFLVHRLGTQYAGCRITMAPSCAVLRQPLSPEELDLLGIDPDHNLFLPVWTPPEGYDLLYTNDDEDLLN